MSNKNKSKRSSSVSNQDQSGKKKRKANDSTPAKKQNEKQTPVPELSSDDSSHDNELIRVVNSVEPAANKEDGEVKDIPSFTFEDMNKLLENVKKALPNNDILKFNTRLEKMDWELVKFNSYTGEDCKKLLNYALSFLKKFKTLTELVTEAQQTAAKPTSKIYRSNKDLNKPRHPSSSYMIFANEIRDKLRKQNPTLSIIEIGKLIGEKWRQLSQAKKDKYIKKFEENKKVYLEEISKYNIEHNQPEKKKRELDKPKTPLMIYLQEKLEKVDDNPDLEGKSVKEKQVYYKNKYNQLSDKKKFKYIKKCQELEEKFLERLKEKLKSTNVDYKSVLNKNEREIVERMNGKPENPPVNGYALFIKENIIKPEIASAEPKLKNSLLANKWKMLDKDTKDNYNSRTKAIQEQFVLDMQNYVKGLPEKEAIELYMRNAAGLGKEIIQKRIESFAFAN